MSLLLTPLFLGLVLSFLHYFSHNILIYCYDLPILIHLSYFSLLLFA